MNRRLYYIIGWEQCASDAVQARVSAWKQSCERANLVFEFFGIGSSLLRENNYSMKLARLLVSVFTACYMLAMCSVKKFKDDCHIIISSPPFFSACAVGLILKARGIPFNVEVRDPYPRTFTDVGIVSKSSVLVKMCQRMEKYLYVNAENIIVTDLFDNLPEFTDFKNKIVFCFNGVNLDDIKEFNNLPFMDVLQSNKDNGLINIVSVGRIGMMQDSDRLINEIKELIRSEKVGSVVMIGDSVDIVSDKLIKVGRIDSFKLHSYIKLCDIGLNFKASNASGDVNIPIRVYEYLAAGLIVRGTLPSDMVKHLSENGVNFQYFSSCGTESTKSLLARASEFRRPILIERCKYMQTFLEQIIDN